MREFCLQEYIYHSYVAWFKQIKQVQYFGLRKKETKNGSYKEGVKLFKLEKNSINGAHLLISSCRHKWLK
jgi:hypothetical protein